jgi:hypothetical protein
VHAHSEQETFYKALELYPQAQSEAGHGFMEHKEIEDQIKLINEATPKNWEQEVLKLKDIVEHHVSEEEGEMFDKAKEVFSIEEAYALKEKMHYLKGSFLLWLDKEEAKLAKEVAD